MKSHSDREVPMATSREPSGDRPTTADAREAPAHCSLDPERLAAIRVVPGSQIRISRSADEVAMYTVSEAKSEGLVD